MSTFRRKGTSHLDKFLVVGFLSQSVYTNIGKVKHIKGFYFLAMVHSLWMNSHKILCQIVELTQLIEYGLAHFLFDIIRYHFFVIWSNTIFKRFFMRLIFCLMIHKL